MNIRLKTITSLILVLAFSSQLQAKNNHSGQGGPPERPSFSSIDTDSDGDINFDEFSSHKLPFGDPQTVFNSIDSDNNGVISSQEFESHKPPHKQKQGRSND